MRVVPRVGGRILEGDAGRRHPLVDNGVGWVERQRNPSTAAPWMAAMGFRPLARASTHPTRSPPGPEKILQQPGRLGLADAAVDLRAVLAGRGGEEAHPALDRAA